MEYKKIINLLNNTPNQTTKFRTKNWVENDNSVEHITLTVKLNLKLQCTVKFMWLQQYIYTWKWNYDNYWGKKCSDTIRWKK